LRSSAYAIAVLMMKDELAVTGESFSLIVKKRMLLEKKDANLKVVRTLLLKSC
jgi:hypothetical protein